MIRVEYYDRATRDTRGAAHPARADGGLGARGGSRAEVWPQRGEAARALDGPPGGYGGARRGWSTPRRGVRRAVGSDAIQVFEW